MKLFTFLGLGEQKRGYVECSYRTETCKLPIKSSFIQIPILLSYNISDIIVFVTQESKENYEHLELEIKNRCNEIKCTSKIIKQDISIIELAHCIITSLDKNDEFAIDLTHSFRSIPIKASMIMEYIYRGWP